MRAQSLFVAQPGAGASGSTPPVPPIKNPNHLPFLKEDEWMLTPTQFARVLGLGRAKFFRLVSTGMIPEPIRFGRCPRWPRWEIYDWINVGCPARDDWRGRNGHGR